MLKDNWSKHESGKKEKDFDSLTVYSVHSVTQCNQAALLSDSSDTSWRGHTEHYGARG